MKPALLIAFAIILQGIWLPIAGIIPFGITVEQYQTASFSTALLFAFIGIMGDWYE